MTDITSAFQLHKFRFVILGSVLVAAALFTTSVLYALLDGQGAEGSRFWAFAFAMFVCWLSATVSLWITARTSSGRDAVSGLFLSILVRTGVPLLCGFVAETVGPFSGTDIFGLVLVHYLVGLFAETLIAVKLVSGNAVETMVG